ncbi:MAG: autotransporter outer membrane beta-barrel domain-containing protein [Alphaproteobacteria bacterium]
MSWANKLTVTGDTQISNADYSDNSGDGGVVVESGNSGNPWQINLTDSLTVDNNANGIWIKGSGIATISGIGDNALITATGNSSWGVNVQGKLNLLNTDIYVSKLISSSALLGGISNTGTMSIDGGTTGKHILIENLNSSREVLGIDSTSTSANSTIRNMSIDIKNNNATSTYFSGLNTKGILNISSTLGNQWINISDNNANQFIYAISVGMNDAPNSKVNIDGMNINISNNASGNSGVKHTIGMGMTGSIKVTGASDGSNMYIFDNNKSYDWVGATESWSGSTEFYNMNIYARGNEGAYTFGLKSQSGPVKVIGASNGNNVIVYSNNTSTTRDNSAIQTGAGVRLDIENTNILVNNNVAGNYFYGIFSHNSQIKGLASGKNSIIIKENMSSGSGFYGFVNYGSMNIENMNIEISQNASANNVVGLYNSGVLNITGISSRNMIILKDNKTTIKNMNIVVDGGDFSSIGNGATFEIENTFVNVLDDSLGFNVYQGLGSNINIKNDSRVVTNSGHLMEAIGVSSGTMNVNRSYVEGSIKTDATATSNLNLSNSAIWIMREDSNLTNLNSANSQINLKSLSTAYNTLTVKNYVGTNSTVYMNTYLGGDSSPTDKIVIDGGSATGKTVLNITNRGGSGEKNVDGIKVVDAQNGAIVANGSFSLYGGKLDTGGYEYKLYQGNTSGTDTNSMYLRTNGELTDIAKGMGNVPSLTLNLAKAGMNSLHKRMGELRTANDQDVNGAWVRSYGRHLTVNDKIDSKINLYGVEGGYDHRIDTDNLSGKFYLGGMIGYLHTESVKTKSIDGNGSGNTPSVGAYATWIGNDGWFVDGVFRYFWEDLDMRSHASNGQVVQYNVKREMAAFSLEAGKQMKFCTKHCSGNFIVEPKVEVGYDVAQGKTFRTNLGDELRYGDTKSFSGKASIMFGYEYLIQYDMIAQPYIQFGVLREFEGKTKINYASATYDSALGGTSYEVGGGGFLKMSKHSSFYSEFLYEKGSKVEAISGNIGFRYTW